MTPEEIQALSDLDLAKAVQLIGKELYEEAALSIDAADAGRMVMEAARRLVVKAEMYP